MGDVFRKADGRRVFSSTATTPATPTSGMPKRCSRSSVGGLMFWKQFHFKEMSLLTDQNCRNTPARISGPHDGRKPTDLPGRRGATRRGSMG